MKIIFLLLKIKKSFEKIYQKLLKIEFFKINKIITFFFFEFCSKSLVEHNITLSPLQLYFAKHSTYELKSL